MDWKIAVAVVVGLVVFFIAYQCTQDDGPDFDQMQAVQQAERQETVSQQEAQEEKEHLKEKREEARKAIGERKDPQTAILESPELRAVLTTRGGAMSSLTLKSKQYLEPPRNWHTGERDEDAAKLVPVDLVTTNTSEYELNTPLRFAVHQGLEALLPEADYELVEQGANRVVFAYRQPGLPVVITKKFELDGKERPYQLWLTIGLTNISENKVRFIGEVVQQGYQHLSEAEGGMFSKQPNLQHAICRHNEDVTREPWGSDDLPANGIGAISFVGVENSYFLAAMVPSGDVPASCHLSYTPQRVVRAGLRWGEITLEAGETKTLRVKNYLGPKKFPLLQKTGHHLEKAVDFGYLWPISRVLLFLLFAFQGVVENWGVAIILLTVVVKTVLLPLTHRSFKSAERMKALKPQMDELNAKHKDEPQAKQQAVMELYKKNKVNPLGGCIPSLLQMPIWFALFRTLRASPELYHAHFFGWITDLSSPDPYYITPLVMGVLMFLQQRITPMAGDTTQAKMMMYFMPIMFTGFMLFLPSGLTLYILVNTVLSIAHQTVIHRRSRTNAAGGKALGWLGKRAARKKDKNA
jgi:YidC/Oxa1 family membrane protein insertase